MSNILHRIHTDRLSLYALTAYVVVAGVIIAAANLGNFTQYSTAKIPQAIQIPQNIVRTNSLRTDIQNGVRAALDSVDSTSHSLQIHLVTETNFINPAQSELKELFGLDWNIQNSETKDSIIFPLEENLRSLWPSQLSEISEQMQIEMNHHFTVPLKQLFFSDVTKRSVSGELPLTVNETTLFDLTQDGTIFQPTATQLRICIFFRQTDNNENQQPTLQQDKSRYIINGSIIEGLFAIDGYGAVILCNPNAIQKVSVDDISLHDHSEDIIYSFNDLERKLRMKLAKIIIRISRIQLGLDSEKSTFSNQEVDLLLRERALQLYEEQISALSSYTEISLKPNNCNTTQKRVIRVPSNNISNTFYQTREYLSFAQPHIQAAIDDLVSAGSYAPNSLQCTNQGSSLLQNISYVLRHLRHSRHHTTLTVSHSSAMPVQTPPPEHYFALYAPIILPILYSLVAKLLFLRNQIKAEKKAGLYKTDLKSLKNSLNK